MAHFIQLVFVTETYKKFMDVATVLSLLLLKCAIKKRLTQKIKQICTHFDKLNVTNLFDFLRQPIKNELKRIFILLLPLLMLPACFQVSFAGTIIHPVSMHCW